MLFLYMDKKEDGSIGCVLDRIQGAVLYPFSDQRIGYIINEILNTINTERLLRSVRWKWPIILCCYWKLNLPLTSIGASKNLRYYRQEEVPTIRKSLIFRKTISTNLLSINFLFHSSTCH